MLAEGQKGNTTLTKSLQFSVDAALFTELGERLVGKPHIALAELVKNSYDADATKVVISVSSDRIEVSDNGQGMTFAEFRHFWMRVGSPHKSTERISRNLKRPLTGSKGVGRLAVQFLAHSLEMYTISDETPTKELTAQVDWDQAIIARELTSAIAMYGETRPTVKLPGDSKHGTKLVLTGLKQEWDPESFRDLAREIWPLQPPFRGNPDLKSDQQKSFKVELKSSVSADVESFDQQMNAVLDLYYARIAGSLTNVNGERKIKLSVTFRTGETFSTTYPLVSPGHLDQLSFEVRVFYLNHRQRYGIDVETARQYMANFGGIHVYDAGFHLPFYAQDDWLDIEWFHSHRRFRSELLPDELQPKGTQGLRYLPTNSRMFGVVHVNTSKERAQKNSKQPGQSGAELSGQYLTVQVTRDRLVDNEAFECLKNTVRWAIDYYAVQEARIKAEEAEANRKTLNVPEGLQLVNAVLEKYRDEVPEPVFNELQTRVKKAVEARLAEAKEENYRLGLLGALATAGISALAYEHEISKQFHQVENIVIQMEQLRQGNGVRDAKITELTDGLNDFLSRARSTRALFSNLMDEQNRETRARFKAKILMDQIKAQMSVLLRGIKVDTSDVDLNLRLPEASYAEWSAVFQNVFLNAVNAMLDSSRRHISVSSEQRGEVRIVKIQDTGSGVKLATSEELFKPFVRKLDISPERRALGLGGTGLGLSIVRMIASGVGCRVAFAEPDAGYSTAFIVSWSEA